MEPPTTTSATADKTTTPESETETRPDHTQPAAISEPDTSEPAPISEPDTNEHAAISEPDTSEPAPISEPDTSEPAPISEPDTSERAPISEPDTSEPAAISDDQKKLYPAVAMYGPYTVTGLKKGQMKMWCVCGLSKRQPWCDGSHRGTGFLPLRWTVPHDQSKYQVCACKYTKSKPLCDGTHTNLPCVVLERQDRCQHRAMCENKLCTDCGFVPDF